MARLIARLVRGSRKKRVSAAPAISHAKLTAVIIAASTIAFAVASSAKRLGTSTKPENKAAIAA